MFGNISPFFTIWGPATATQGGILTTSGQTVRKSGAMVWEAAAQAGAAETIMAWQVQDDTIAKAELKNLSTSNNDFLACFDFTASSTNQAAIWRGNITADSGSGAVWAFNCRKTTTTAVLNRALWEIQNASAVMLQLIPTNAGANAALTWGTQATAAPALSATRTAGERIVLHALADATHADFAIGMAAVDTAYVGLPIANSTYLFGIYAGANQIFAFRGDGRFVRTGGNVRKTRIALTTPVTVAVGTDDIVEVNLTTPGAVAINLPAAPTTGTEFVLVDGKGDSGANNHTVAVTGAAQNVNGAASVVVASNYYRRAVFYNGTQYLIG